MSYLGLDLGTSGLRALLIDESGVPTGVAERSYPSHQPHAGWSEQDPEDWIVALNGAVGVLVAKYPEMGAVKGIGVAQHMHGGTFLDRKGQVICP